MFDQNEVQQIEQYVVFPVNKETLLKILYDNHFSIAICNAIQDTSYVEFNSFKDVAYALNNYKPSVI